MRIVFDLDGTLIDSDPDIRAAVNRVLAAENHPPLTRAQVQSMIGDGAAVLLDRAFAARGVTAQPHHLAAFLADYEANAVVETAPYDGIIEALETLRAAGHQLGVCTNKPAAPARHVLEKLRLAPYFSAITGGDSTPHRKPHPAPLAATLSALGGDAPAIMVGDHHNDMESAAALEIPSIFVSWGYGAATGTYRAEHPSEIPALIHGS
jgi:phosphoglycolate phosphatase